MRNEQVSGNKPDGRTDPVLAKFTSLYEEAIAHDGFAEIRVEIRILKRGQKEVILHCGKQYRFVVDCLPGGPAAQAQKPRASVQSAVPASAVSS
jgi:hypothetical protein